MLIGVPKEIKNHEYRVGMTPGSVKELTGRGHRVLVETSAGIGIGFSDQDYIDAGANISPDAATIFAESEMVVKVKEPQACERAMLREGQILFTYLHLAPDAAQTEDLINSKAVCIAYETVTSDKNTLPLLAAYVRGCRTNGHSGCDDLARKSSWWLRNVAWRCSRCRTCKSNRYRSWCRGS